MRTAPTTQRLAINRSISLFFKDLLKLSLPAEARPSALEASLSFLSTSGASILSLPMKPPFPSSADPLLLPYLNHQASIYKDCYDSRLAVETRSRTDQES